MGAFYRLLAGGVTVALLAASCSGSHHSPVAQQQASAPPAGADHVYFRPVLCTIAPQSPDAVPAPAQSACQSSTPSMIDSTPDNQDSPASVVILPYIRGGVRYVLGPADLTSTDLASAQAESGSQGYEVVLTLTSAGIRKLDAVAAVRYSFYKQDPSNPPAQSKEAVEQGHTVLMAPAIQAPAFNGSVLISLPNLSQQGASSLVVILNRIIAYDRVHPIT